MWQHNVWCLFVCLHLFQGAPKFLLPEVVCSITNLVMYVSLFLTNAESICIYKHDITI
jgi:hypothetical protein